MYTNVYVWQRLWNNAMSVRLLSELSDVHGAGRQSSLAYTKIWNTGSEILFFSQQEEKNAWLESFLKRIEL